MLLPVMIEKSLGHQDGKAQKRPPRRGGGLIYRELRELSGVFYYAVHNTATVRLYSIAELYGSGAGPASSGIDGPVGRSRRYWHGTKRTSSH